MDNAQEKSMGQMADAPAGQQPDTAAATIADICQAADVKPDTVSRAWRRACTAGTVSRPFSMSLVPTDLEAENVPALAKAMGKTAQPAKRVATVPVKAATVAQPRAVAATQPKAQPIEATPAQPVAPPADWPMWAIMGATTVATVQNMATVTGNLFNGDMWASWTLTALLSAVPFVVSLQKTVNAYAKALVAALVVAEIFCNMTRIYAGLTNFDTPGYMGYPTRFLGMVTDMLGSGTYPTARVLAGAIALIIAGIFAVSFQEINKKKL